MRKTALFSFLLPLPFTCVLFGQEPNKPAPYDGAFAYAINTRQLVTISKDVNESNARLLTKAICPTHSISSAIRLAPLTNKDDAGRTIFQYDADSEIPAGNYCLLVDSKAHQKLFTWGSGDTPEFLYEKKCFSETAEQAESLTGRKIASCYLIGGYGTGRLELIEYASDSPRERLAALMVIDYSPIDERSRYSIIRFPAASAIWRTEKDGKFHPERFRHLFTISDDPGSQVWLVALEWAGPAGRDLTLYQPVGTELRPILVNHDSSHHDKQSSDIALK
jgi:hypothetical protein